MIGPGVLRSSKGSRSSQEFQEFSGVIRSFILLTTGAGGPNQNAAHGGEWRRRRQAF